VQTSFKSVLSLRPAHNGVSLSCPATGRPRGTPLRPRLKTTTGGLPRGSLWDPRGQRKPPCHSQPELCPWHLRLVRPSAVSLNADLAERRLIYHPKTSGTLRRNVVNHRGSSSSAKHWCHRHTGAHLSTNFEQTLRRHDAVRAADCRHPLGGGGGDMHSHPHPS